MDAPIESGLANSYETYLRSTSIFSFPYLCKLIMTHFLYVVKEWLYVYKEVSELGTAAKSLHMTIKRVPFYSENVKLRLFCTMCQLIHMQCFDAFNDPEAFVLEFYTECIQLSWSTFHLRSLNIIH
jgi:hypothetical protein